MQIQTMKKRPRTGGFAAAMPKTKGVAQRVSEITTTDSPTMRLARTRAQQQANSRGLGNSSIAIGAGELAAIEAALPMASQDSAQENQRVLSRQGFLQQSQLQDDSQEFAAGESKLDRSLTREQAEAERLFRRSEREGAQEFTAGESALSRAQQTSERKGAQEFAAGENALSRQQQTAEREASEAFAAGESALSREQQTSERLGAESFAFTQSELDRGLTREQAEAEREFRTSERKGAEEFASSEASLDREFRSGEAATARDFEAVQRLADRELSADLQEMAQEFNASEAEIARSFELTRLAETQDFQANQSELERISRETVASWNIDASERAGAAQFVANSQATHAQAYSAVLQNTEINAKARQQQLIQLRKENIRRLNLGEQLYGIKLEF